MRGKVQIRRADWAIGELAGRQHGVVARAQLIGLGLGEDAIDGRLRSGRLHRLHRGVYAVGHRAVPREGRWMAAVLACGPGAVLSHRSAAALWGMRGHSGGAIEVTAPRSCRSGHGIRRHCAALPAEEVTIEHAIPVTTVPRTLFDLAAVRAESIVVERALREAETAPPPTIALSLATCSTATPAGVARRDPGGCLAAGRSCPAASRASELEERFVAFLDRLRPAAPPSQCLARCWDGKRVQVDCLWAEQSVRWSSSTATQPTARASPSSEDRDRDRRLEAAGCTVIRLTWRQLHDAPERHRG